MFYNHSSTPLCEATLVNFFFLAPNKHIYGAQKNLNPSWHHGCWHRSMECCASGTQQARVAMDHVPRACDGPHVLDVMLWGGCAPQLGS